jgi:8-oxo-dGTP pyrophosphatase MutT (NUDIX family)
MSMYDPNYIHKKTYALIGQKAIIVNEEKKLLVLERSDKTGGPGLWSLPGGALEDKEDPMESIQREIKEETGIETPNIKPFFTRSYSNKDNDFVVIIGYTCHVNNHQVTLNWEHSSYKWVTKQEALALNLSPDGRFFIEIF